MPKKSSDRLYMKASEWSQDYGGKVVKLGGAGNMSRTLPFDCCALSLNPFKSPICNLSGIIFDVMSILPFIKEHKLDPTTGLPCSRRDLVSLNMSKNEDGAWHCPVLCKPFSNFTKICAVRHGATANVFSYEAVLELNIKGKNYEDLLDGQPFKKSDIIILQDVEDAQHMKLRDINNFKHTTSSKDSAASKNSAAGDIKHSVTATRIMEAVAKKKAEDDIVKRKKELETKKANEILAAERNINIEDRLVNVYTNELMANINMTTNATAGSLTSTAETVSLNSSTRLASDEEIMQAKIRAARKYKKKGFASLTTTYGNMVFELDCDIAPRTCENFLGLLEKKYYDGTAFHRNIPGFMLQGGDPMGTGRGGESLWGGKFVDEFDSRLSHSARGILCMANAGPNTNRSQFFVTYAPCTHLDMKHTVFGRIIQGEEVLLALEGVPTDKNDKPKTEMKIISSTVIENPIVEVEKMEMAKIREARAAIAKNGSGNGGGGGKKRKVVEENVGGVGGVGRYIIKTVEEKVDLEVEVEVAKAEVESAAVAPKKAKFNNFSGW